MQTYIELGEHVFIAGRTGTGKTYLTRKYLAGYERVWVLDTKGTLEWREVPKDQQVTITRLVDLKAVNVPKVIYKPEPEEMLEEFYNAFFKAAYFARNLIVWIDEAMSVCPSPHKIPEYYKAILTRGRELKVSAWSLTQRPTGIPQIIISESTHIFAFDLNMPQDRAKIAEVSGATEFYAKPSSKSKTRYGFWYYNVSWESAKLARLVERRK